MMQPGAMQKFIMEIVNQMGRSECTQMIMYMLIMLAPLNRLLCLLGQSLQVGTLLFNVHSTARITSIISLCLHSAQVLSKSNLYMWKMFFL